MEAGSKGINGLRIFMSIVQNEDGHDVYLDRLA